MTTSKEFYGHVLRRGRRYAPSRQLYDVLRREILRGRWAIGERLPSYKNITKLTGLSQKPIQSALDRLETDGYVERIRHKGIFVKATATPGNNSLGTVIIPVPADAPREPDFGRAVVDTKTFGQIRVGRLVREAHSLGLLTHVLPVSEDAVSPVHDMALTDDVFGVISLFSSDRTERIFGRELDRVVYLGTDDPLAQPALDGSPFTAAYGVTEVAVARGHRCIAVVPSPAVAGTSETWARAGIAAALARQGIPADSRALPVMPAADAPVPREATAVFCFCLETARQCLESVGAAGFRVPEDLSLLSLQTGHPFAADGRQAFGAAYKWDEIVTTCFKILMSAEGLAAPSAARITFAAGIGEGDTLAAPRATSVGGQSASTTAILKNGRRNHGPVSR
jgi:hypothetical protein